MKIAVGADHAGFGLKESLRDVLAGQGHEVLDLGRFDPSKPDYYPGYAVAVGRALQEGSPIGVSSSVVRASGSRWRQADSRPP